MASASTTVDSSQPVSGASSLARRVLRGGVWVALGRFVSLAGGLVVNSLLARQLVPGEFGDFVLLRSLAGFAAICATFGAETMTVRLLAENLAAGLRDRARAALRNGGYVVAVATLLVGLAVLAGLWFFGERFPGSTLFLLAVTLTVVGLAWNRFVSESLRGMQEMRFASLMWGHTGGPITTLLFIGSLAAVGLLSTITLTSVVLLNALSILVVLPFGFWFLRATARRSLTGGATATASLIGDPTNIGRVLLAGCPVIMLTSVLTTATEQSDIWMAGLYCESEQLALYGAARRLIVLVSVPLDLVNLTLVASIPALYSQGRRAELQRLVSQAVRWAGGLSIAALAVLLLFPQPILELIYGSYYQSAALFLLILAVGQIVYVWAGVAPLVLIMTGKHNVALAANAVLAALLLAIVPPVAKAYGPVGLASSYIGLMAVHRLALWAIAGRLTGIWTHFALPIVPALQLAKKSGSDSSSCKVVDPNIVTQAD